MQAYEHVWTVLANLAKRGMSKEEALNVIRENSAYSTLTDSIRSELNPTPDGSLKAYRPLSHYTDGAWMELPCGEDLKNFGELENVNYYLPENAERKAADGPTDLVSFIEHNKTFLKDNHSVFTVAHLKQDMIADRVLQAEVATAYYTSGTGQEDTVITKLYGLDTKGGLCKFNKTGKIGSMTDFRNMVTLFSTLTSIQLWSSIQQSYPDMTTAEVADIVRESYDRHYSESMSTTASKFISPNPLIEKLMSVNKLEESVQIAGIEIESIDDIKDSLVEIGAFSDIREAENTVSQTVTECVNVFGDLRICTNNREKSTEEMCI